VRVVEIREQFGLENLALRERPQQEPEPGQVRLRMGAASLNARDLMMLRGQYNPRQPLPLVPGSDGVGEVVALGRGVERIKIGDRVAPIFAQGWISGRPDREKIRSTLGGPLDGTFAEEMLVGAESVVKVPDHLSDEEAATLPTAAVTAWNALVGLGTLGPGQTVLIQGTGGVSIFALQFARLLGARVILTSSSDEKLERARALGAAETINYVSFEDWGRRARELSGADGVDLVVEVGGAGTLEQSLAAVRPGGQISLIGVLSGAESKLSVIPMFMKQVRLQGILVGSRETFCEMNRAIAAHQLRPAVSKIFAFDDVRDALEHLDRGLHFGKICLRIH
jgi:NADPH:quinone reductase-like Zn-dependent oxidoreductase